MAGTAAERLDERKAMIIGTAGLTAMLCVMALEEGGVHPDDGDILVTGASARAWAAPPSPCWRRWAIG